MVGEVLGNVVFKFVWIFRKDLLRILGVFSFFYGVVEGDIERSIFLGVFRFR